jgi:hypothetical protein
VVRMATSAGRFLALEKAVKEARFGGESHDNGQWETGRTPCTRAGRDPLNEIASQTYLPI